MERKREPQVGRAEEPGMGVASVQARPSMRRDVLDLEVIAGLRELGGEDEPELLPDLIRLFLSDAEQRLTEMRAALCDADLGAVARAAHTLKSSAGSIGATRFSQLCRELEEVARRGSMGDVEARIATCLEVWAETERALEKLAG